MRTPQKSPPSPFRSRPLFVPREFCELTSSCQQMLRHSVEEMGLSARAHDKILRVALSIADVSGDEDIDELHLAEAIGYRSLDRDLWV